MNNLKKRILYVSTHPHLNLSAPSGPGTHIREVINAFRDKGHEVQTFIAGGEVLEKTGRTITFKKSKWKAFVPDILWNTLKELVLLRHNFKMKSQLRKVVDTFQPDFIYERGYFLMTATMEVAHERGIEAFCELNAPYPEEVKQMGGRGLFHFLSNQAETKQTKLSSKIVVVSTAMRDYFIRRTGISGSKIIVTPNAVRSDFNKIDSKEVQAIKMKNGILESDIVFGFVGSIFPYHGVDRLIEAFADLKEAGASKLLIVGDGEVLPNLKLLAIEKGIEGRVIFTGNIAPTEVPAHIACMDVAVMAWSNWYGSPVKIFEYGSLGKFIIAPDKSPVRDVMIHEMDGYITNGSIADLKRGMSLYLNNKSACIDMASHFQSKVLTQYTWDKVGKTIMEAWE